MYEVHVIFNPVAGQGCARRAVPLLRAQLDNGYKTQWSFTSRPGDAHSLAATAVRRGASVVVVAGGDGTVNEVVNGLLSVEGGVLPTVALAPVGSANDFARGLGIGTVAEGMGRLHGGDRRLVDIGRIVDGAGFSRYFAFSAGFGFVAAVAAERYRIRHVRSRWLYLVAALRTLLHWRDPLSLAIGYEANPPVQQRLTLVSINNGPTVGGFPLTPGAQMDDGQFDVLTVAELAPPRMIRLLLSARFGRHLDHGEFECRRCSRLHISAGQPLAVHLDGQVDGFGPTSIGNLEIGLVPGALPVAA